MLENMNSCGCNATEKCQKPKKERKCCADLILVLLSTVLIFIVGIIIGALTGILALLGIGAIIAILVILVLLIIARIIMLLCSDKKNC